MYKWKCSSSLKMLPMFLESILRMVVFASVIHLWFEFDLALEFAAFAPRTVVHLLFALQTPDLKQSIDKCMKFKYYSIEMKIK